MSKEALQAYENFILEDPRSSELSSTLAHTLFVLAYKTLPKEPFVYYLGDSFGAAYCRVSEDQFRNRRKDLVKLGLIVCIEEHAFRNKNKRFLLKCLLPEEEKGMSALPPLETSKVGVEPAKGRSKGRSLTPERYEPAPSNKSEIVKIESKAEQLFNALILLLPNFYSSIKYASNLEELFSDLAANYEPELLAHYLKRKDLGKLPSAYLFTNFSTALQAFQKDPRQAIEDYEKNLQHKQAEEEEQTPKEPYLARDKLAELVAEAKSVNHAIK